MRKSSRWPSPALAQKSSRVNGCEHHARDSAAVFPSGRSVSPRAGRPEMKARVPSIGSITQTCRRSAPFGPILLADDPVVGERLADQIANGAFGRPVGLGDGIESRLPALLAMGAVLPETRQGLGSPRRPPARA